MSEKGPENEEIMGNYMKLPPTHGHSSWDLDGFRICIFGGQCMSMPYIGVMWIYLIYHLAMAPFTGDNDDGAMDKGTIPHFGQSLT